MAYTLRTKDNAGDNGRAADQNESVDNDIFFNGQHLTGVTAWQPDKPPASAGAQDDEFDNAALSVSWTEYDPDAKTTWTEGNGGLTAAVATSAAHNINGLHRTLPDGDFTIYTKVGMASTLASQFNCGLCLWEDPTGDNELFTWQCVTNVNPCAFRAVAYTWVNHTTTAIAKHAETTLGTGSLAAYLRIRRNAANYYCDVSLDGYGWQNMGGAFTFVFTPTKFGICVENQNTGVNQYAHFQFFRYIASDVGLGGVMAGDRG